MGSYEAKVESLAKKVNIKNETVRQFFAECLGTLILVAFGDGSLAQFTLGRGQFGTFHSVAFSWGLGITLGVFVCGGVSGGHINPAVSLAMAIFGKLPWWKVPIYWLAQYLGAILASAFIYAVYLDALNDFDGGTRVLTGANGTAGIWASYPKDFLSAGGGMADQVFATALILCCILAITDSKNMNCPKGLQPVCIGFIFFAVGMAYGFNCGFPVNPARDLGPRIFTAMAGWGTEPFTFRNHNWFWIPIVGPHLGAIIGAIFYQFLVGFHMPEEDEYDVYQMEDLDKPKKGQENRAYSDGSMAI